MTKSTSWIDGEGVFKRIANIDRVPHVTLAPRISGEDTFVISSRLGSGRACLILLYWLIYFETRFSGLCLGRRLVVLENKENTDHKQGRLEPCRHLPNRQGGRTKCQPDKMPTWVGILSVTFFCGWHFVRTNFLVGILSGPSQEVLASPPTSESGGGPVTSFCLLRVYKFIV